MDVFPAFRLRGSCRWHTYFDIKPYIAYADSEPEAKSSFAQEKPPAKLNVEFTEIAPKCGRKNITKIDRT